MNKQIAKPKRVAVKDQSIERLTLTAVARVNVSRLNYIFDVVAAGCGLLELRAKYSIVHGRNQHSEGQGYLEWLAKYKIAPKTAWRWERAAQVTLRVMFGIKSDSPEATPIPLMFRGISIARILLAFDTLGVEDEQIIRFHSEVTDFLQQRSIADLLEQIEDKTAPPVSDGEALQIAGGVANGGYVGENRKDFVSHGARALMVFISHLGAPDEQNGRHGGHWNALDAAEKNEAYNLMNHAFQAMPDELLQHSIPAVKKELERRMKDGGQPRPGAVKAYYAERSLQGRNKASIRRKAAESTIPNFHSPRR